eukprot:4214934-Amphidinium_carterae.2
MYRGVSTSALQHGRICFWRDLFWGRFCQLQPSARFGGLARKGRIGSQFASAWGLKIQQVPCTSVCLWVAFKAKFETASIAQRRGRFSVSDFAPMRDMRLSDYRALK